MKNPVLETKENFSGNKHFESKNIKSPKLEDSKNIARIITDCWKNNYKNILPEEFNKYFMIIKKDVCH